MRPTLVIDAILGMLISGLYVYVGWLLGRRPTRSSEARRALRSFATWWYALAGLTLAGAGNELLGGFDVLDRAPHVILLYATLPLLALALWGLVDYLAYIYAGTPRYRPFILAFHVAFGLYLFGLVVWMFPQTIVATDWTVLFTYQHELQGPLLAFTLALLLAPVLIASAAYFLLAFRVEDPTSRFRVLTVSSAFLLWFGSAALATPLKWNAWYWWPLASRAIALGATLLILLAYRPPRALQSRLDARRALRAPASGSDPRPPRLSHGQEHRPGERV